MPFNPVCLRARASRDASRNPDGVSIAIYHNKSRKRVENGTYLTFFIGVNVLRDMGLKPGQRVLIAEGNGPDHGMFQITPAGPGSDGVTLSVKSTSKARLMAIVSVRTVLLRTLCNLTTLHIAEPATFQRFGSALVVVVPWCHAPVTTLPIFRPKQKSLIESLEGCAKASRS